MTATLAFQTSLFILAGIAIIAFVLDRVIRVANRKHAVDYESLLQRQRTTSDRLQTTCIKLKNIACMSELGVPAVLFDDTSFIDAERLSQIATILMSRSVFRVAVLGVDASCVSLIALAQKLGINDCSFIFVDHLEANIAATKSIAKAAGHESAVVWHHCPLESDDDVRYVRYQSLLENLGNTEVDLLLINGMPPHVQADSRYPVLPRLSPIISSTGMVMLNAPDPAEARAAAATCIARESEFSLAPASTRPLLRRRPLINVLTRTSDRPDFFNRCRQSVLDQLYPRVNHLICADTDSSAAYLESIPHLRVKRTPRDHARKRMLDGYLCYHAPYNLYINELMTRVQPGWVMLLDDDDEFMHPECLNILESNLGSEDELVLWRVQFPQGVLIPEDEYFGKPPVCTHISSIGFAVHTKYREHLVYDEDSCSDFRAIRRLHRVVPSVRWIPDVLTGLQREDTRGGFGYTEADEPSPEERLRPPH